VKNKAMNPKSLIWIGMFVGSAVGGLVPLLWGGSSVSLSSIVFSTVGGVAGVYGGFKLSRMI
jgi:hypothetical protein